MMQTHKKLNIFLPLAINDSKYLLTAMCKGKSSATLSKTHNETHGPTRSLKALRRIIKTNRKNAADYCE